MKIVADDSMPLVQELFSPYGHVITLPGREISSSDVRDADILLVRSVTKVNKSLLKSSKVKFVGSATIGADHVDQDYLKDQDIDFSNAPGCNSNAVIQYVISVLYTLRPNWMEQTIGIVGCGNIGGRLYTILNNFGVNCLCYDPYLSVEKNDHLVTFEEVLESDILSLHVPLTTCGAFPTHHLFSDNIFASLKSSTLLINTSRGAVIDNQSLLNFLPKNSWQLALDVWENEPDILIPLLKLVDICTPHIAGYSYDGKIKGTQMIFDAFCFKYNLNRPDRTSSEKLFKLLPSSVVSAVLETFDVKNIDHMMRSNLLKQSSRIPLEFDRLRKECPKRYEFKRYLLSEDTDNLLVKNLLKLGFSKR